MASSIGGPLGAVLHQLHNAASYVDAAEHARNQHLNILFNLRDNGIGHFDALHMANLLAYSPNTVQTQNTFLNMLKAGGYLSHQAY